MPALQNVKFSVSDSEILTHPPKINPVPIESVSKMLGHTSIKTTQHYAKILDKKVSDDMKILKDKFSGKTPAKPGRTA